MNLLLVCRYNRHSAAERHSQCSHIHSNFVYKNHNKRKGAVTFPGHFFHSFDTDGLADLFIFPTQPGLFYARSRDPGPDVAKSALAEAKRLRSVRGRRRESRLLRRTRTRVGVAITAALVTQPMRAGAIDTLVITENSSTSLTAILNGNSLPVTPNGADHWTIALAGVSG